MKKCHICPHHCNLDSNQTGICRGRKNIGDEIICLNYGKLTSIALDPIEKKPLARFMPGSMILSVGSFGCNLSCPFCQNHSISTAGENNIETIFVSPQDLIQKALELKPSGNIGIAYTYNEPLISYEYVLDCAKLAHENNLKNVIVTAGYICEEPFKELLPYVDAMNIDLKSFNEGFYKKINGKLETVKDTIQLAAKSCHLEVTTLVIPDENDKPEEIESLAAWLADISGEIVLHISRFFPRHKYDNKGPTPVSLIYELAKVAKKYLKFVYTGNC